MAFAPLVVAVAASVASGVMAYKGAQQQASAQRQAARLQLQQAEQNRKLAGLRALQTTSAHDAAELQLQEERLQMRRAAAQVQERSIAQAASRGIMARPFGSLEAIMESSNDKLYEDLEANRLDRIYKSTAYALEMAGIWEEAAAFDQNARAQAQIYRTQARTSQYQGYSALISSAANTYSIAKAG